MLTLIAPRITGQLVFLPQRVHLFPFRTQKLSSAEATILAWRRAGKIAQCQHYPIQLTRVCRLAVLVFIPHRPQPIEELYSSLAQSVEHLTVNQGVVGSSPTGGAKKKALAFASAFFNDVFRKRNVMCTSCVMFPLEVKCAFGTCYGTHYITANEASNITVRSITSLWRSQNFTKI